MEYSSIFKLVLRVLVSPFVLGIIIITYVFYAFKKWIAFIRYGGEWINYEKKEVQSIEYIYKSLKKERHEQ